MAIKYIIVLFVETPRTFAVINLRGVSTNKTIIMICMLISLILAVTLKKKPFNTKIKQDP